MGYAHGQGIYSWRDGVVYEGDMEWGAVTGRGTLTWPGGNRYEGDVRGGLPHGTGRQVVGDAVYDGEWCDGLRHGQGRLVIGGSDGLTYTGGWSHDAREGAGVCVFANGDHYSGDWRDDRRCGRGTMVWASRAEEYRGDWVDGLPHGEGEHVWWLRLPRSKLRASQTPRCNRYVGEFRRGARGGYGRMLYANGGYYEGEWEDDQREGRGVLVLENGAVTSTTWREGKPAEAPRRPVASRGPRVAADDVVAECLDEDPEACRRGLATVLARFASELRHVYDTYAALPIPGAVSARDLGLRDCLLYTSPSPRDS